MSIFDIALVIFAFTIGLPFCLFFLIEGLTEKAKEQGQNRNYRKGGKHNPTEYMPDMTISTNKMNATDSKKNRHNQNWNSRFLLHNRIVRRLVTYVNQKRSEPNRDCFII
jgi:hypothetical protein